MVEYTENIVVINIFEKTNKNSYFDSEKFDNGEDAIVWLKDQFDCD